MSHQAASSAPAPVGRLLSLDAFRGGTIALMILVNHPGSWAHIHPPLRHARWHGWTPTDLVFPFFLFIVGAAMALSFERRREQGAERSDLVRKILWRSLWIFACGLLLNAYPFGLPLSSEAAANFTLESVGEHFANLRILGVLQRIAFCYLAAGLAVVGLSSPRRLAAFAAGCLVLYELAMRLPLVSGWGAGSFALENNLVRWLDLRLLGENHLWKGAGLPFDPEGFLSTLPAIATTVSGWFAGRFVRDRRPERGPVARLAAAGALAAGLGLLLGRWEPVNKQLWSSSYTLLTSGLAAVALAACWGLVDGRGWRRGAFPAIVFGSNPLVVFVGSGLLARTLALVRIGSGDGGTTSVQRWLYLNLFQPAAGDLNGSLLHAVAHVLFWLAITGWLYRRRLFLKI